MNLTNYKSWNYIPVLFLAWSVILIGLPLTESHAQRQIASRDEGQTYEEVREDFITPDSEMGYFRKFFLGKRMEQILRDNLTRYFHPDLFFVAVRFEETKFGEAQEGIQEEVQLQMNNPPLNSRDPGMMLEGLPGLPQYRGRAGSAEEIAQELGEILQYSGEAGSGGITALYELDRLEINYILDPLIEVGMEDLIRKLTLYSLKISEEERVIVNFERYPLFDLFADLGDKPKVDSLQVGFNLNSSGNQLLNTDWSPFEEMGMSLWTYLLLFLLGLFLLYFGYEWMKGRSQKDAKDRGIIKAVHDVGEAAEKSLHSKEQHKEIHYGIEELSQEAVKHNFADYLVRHTEEVGKVFTQWLEDRGEEGLRKVRTILHPMGKSTYSLVFPYLSPKAQAILIHTVEKHFSEESPDLREDYIAGLKEMIGTKIGIDNMAFIEFLSEDELFALLDDLVVDKAVLIFRYLDDLKVSAYFEHVSDQRASDLIMTMNESQILMKDDVDDLGDYLVKKLFELRFWKKYGIGDWKTFKSSFESLPLDRQHGILDAIFEKDFKLYTELKKEVLMWEDLPFLSNEIIRSATQDFSAQDLSIAYKAKGMDMQPIIDLRPEREQQYIYELAGNMDDVLLQKVEELHKKILQSIHEKLKMYDGQKKK